MRAPKRQSPETRMGTGVLGCSSSTVAEAGVDRQAGSHCANHRET
jgi:hypothetical protein